MPGENKPPAKVEVPKDHGVEEVATIRVTIPLCFRAKEMHDKLYPAPEYSLKLAGVKAKEVKTYGRTNEKSVSCGYATFDKKEIPNILKLAGVGGIFFTQLAQDVIRMPPVQWIQPVQDETPINYLQRVQALGKEKDAHPRENPRRCKLGWNLTLGRTPSPPRGGRTSLGTFRDSSRRRFKNFVAIMSFN